MVPSPSDEPAQPQAAEPAIERRIVTVLFADLVGFTSLSERLDPEDVASVQDAYFATVRDTITRYGGALEKFIGDAAMAAFGIPLARDDDALRAVRAGLALVSAVEQLGPRMGLDEAALVLRVGINTGEVIHAESGPDRGRVTGDTVNLAARLQTAAAPGSVLVGEVTSLSVSDAVELEPVGALELKGKAEPVRAWMATGLRADPSRQHALGTLHAPLLGRTDELQLLTEAVGTTARWVIVAPPGVGKSRLLAEFASAADATVLRARVRPEVVAPYEPVAQLLRATLEAADLETGLARLEPERAAVVREEVEALLSPTAARAEVSRGLADEREARFSAWTDALDALSGEAPSAWVIEDVHWAGGDLLAFLAHAGHAPSASGRLVLATARPSLLERAPDWCAPAADVVVMDLSPLAATDSRALVRALVGDALPDELLARVAERSDGNALFIEELLRTWIAVGTLVPAGGGWRLAIPATDVPMPATVQAIYAAQLDDLPAEARLVARRGSVAGRRFPVDALAPLEVPSPEAGLEVLRLRGFVAGPQPDPLSGEVYAYRHALLRDAGYASLSRAERARLHLALARWLEQAAGPRAIEIAEPIGNHYASALASMPALATGATDRDELGRQAATWFERAADASLAIAAHEAAVDLLRRAAELTPAPDRIDLARRRQRRGEVLTTAGNMDEGIGELQAAIEGYRAARGEGGDEATARAGLAVATAALGHAWCEQVRFTQAMELADVTLREIGGPPDASVARLLALRGLATASQGVREGPDRDADAALEIGRKVGDPVLELQLRLRRVQVRSEMDLVGAEEWEEVGELARKQRDWGTVASALRIRPAFLPDGAHEEASALLDEAADLATARGLTEHLAWAEYGRAALQLVAGDWSEALDAGRRVIELSARNAYIRPMYRTWVVLLPIAAAQRRTDLLAEFAGWWESVKSVFPPTPSPYAAVLFAASDRYLAVAGLPPTARPFDPDAILAEQYEGGYWLAAVETLMAGWIKDGEIELARRQHAAIEAQTAGAARASALSTTSNELIAAWLDRADGLSPEARARASLAAARTARAPWWIARSLRALGQAAAAHELSEAAAIEDSLGIASARG